MVNVHFLDFLDFLDFRVDLDLRCLRRVILRRLMPPTSEGTCGALTAVGADSSGFTEDVENKLVSLFPMSLTVPVTALVADSVADFSVSFNSFALVETVSAIDAGVSGAAGNASAIVSAFTCNGT